MSKELLSEINKATQDTSEAWKDIWVIEAKLLIEKIEKSSYKSQELDIFLSKIKEAYNKIDKEKQDYKDFVLLKTWNDLENIKKELETKTQEEDKKADIKAEKTWKTNILKWVWFESIENEKIRTNLLEYLKIHAFWDDVIKMLEWIRDNYPEIYDDENFCEKLLKINPYISQYIENENIINNLIWKIEYKWRFLILTQNTEKLKKIIDIASWNKDKFDNLIYNTDLFEKNIDPEIQKYILKIAQKNKWVSDSISLKMHKFDINLIPEEFKQAKLWEIDKLINDYLKTKNLQGKTIQEIITISKNDDEENYIWEISRLIVRSWWYINEKINIKYLNPIKEHFYEELKSWKSILNDKNINIIKALNFNDDKNSVDFKINEFIQEKLINEISKWEFWNHSKNIEYFWISLEKWFPIDENKIKQLFDNQDKIIMNLPLNHKNEKEIQNFYSLIWDIKEFIVKSKSLTNIELLKKSEENIKSFKEIQQNSFPEKIKESLKNFYKNNKWKFKDWVKEEDLEKVDFTTIETSLKWFREIFKEDIKDGDLIGIAKIYREILHYESEENIKKRKELEQWLNPYAVKKLTSTSIVENLKDNIICNWWVCSLWNDDFINLAKNAIWEKEFNKLWEKWQEKAVELVKNQAKTVENEIKNKNVNNVINKKEYRVKYLDFANWKINETELKEEVKKLDEKEAEKEKITPINTQIWFSIWENWQNYFIKSWEEKVDLSYTEYNQIWNSPEKIKAVFEFKKEMDDLWLWFLWKDREILFQNIKNIKWENSINIYDWNISEFEFNNILEYIWNSIWLEKKSNLKDYKESFEKIISDRMFKWKDYTKFDKNIIFIEIFKDKWLFTENTINLKKDI